MAKESNDGDEMRTSRKDKITLAAMFVTFGVVFVVLIAEIALVMTSSEQQGRSSPESAFSDMIGGLDHGDFTKVYDVSVFSLNMTYFEFRTEVGDMLDADYDIVVEQANVIMKSQMTQTQKDEAESFIPQLEDMTGTQVNDYCLIDFVINMTVKRNGETQTQDSTGTILCVKVDSKWYLVFPFGNEEETTPAVSLTRSIITDGVKLTLVAITDNDVAWGDIDIILADNSTYVTWHPNTADLTGSSVTSFNYSTQSLGSLPVNCSVVDLAGNGGINAGDFVTLRTYDGSTTFSPGVTYTVTLVYKPTAGEMGRIQFTG